MKTKSVFLVAAFLIPNLVLADGKVMPNGQTCNPGWICVPPGKKHAKKVAKKPKPAQQPVVVEKTVTVEKTTVVEKEVVQKNHLRLLGGIGPTGTGDNIQPNLVILNQNYKGVFGVAYGRNVSEHWSLEFEGLTNVTGLVGIGLNF